MPKGQGFTQEEFIQKSKEVESKKLVKGILNYSKCIFKTMHTKVILGCDNHLETFWFNKKAKGNIYDKEGCPICENRKLNWTNYSIDFYLKDNNLQFKRISNYKGNNIPIEFLCLKNNHKIVSTLDNVFNGQCGGCFKDSCWSNEKVDNILKEQNRDHLVKRIGDVENCTKPIKWQCLINLEHNNWNANINCVINNKSECRDCYNQSQRMTIKEFVFRAKELHKNNYDYDSTIFPKNHNKNSKVNIWCNLCNKQHKFLQKIIDHLSGAGCPFIKKKNEKRVYDFLIENNINFYDQYIIKNFKNKNFIDFYLPKYNLFLEYNGSQHYSPEYFTSLLGEEKGLKAFKKQQARDQKIKEYCAKNNINLFEIDGRKYKGKSLYKYLKNEFINDLNKYDFSATYYYI